MRENASISSIVASAARAAGTTTGWLTNEGHSKAHVIIDVTAAQGTTALFTCTIQGRVDASSKSYNLLVSPNITSTGVNVLKIGPGIAASANAAAQDMLPYQWRVKTAHTGAQTLTYAIHANLGI